MIHTHKKRSYGATCTQWTDHISRSKVIAILREHGVEVELYKDHALILRFHDGRTNNIDTMQITDWIVIKENKQIKRYTTVEFPIQYEGI